MLRRTHSPHVSFPSLLLSSVVQGIGNQSAICGSPEKNSSATVGNRGNVIELMSLAPHHFADPFFPSPPPHFFYPCPSSPSCSRCASMHWKTTCTVEMPNSIRNSLPRPCPLPHLPHRLLPRSQHPHS